MIIDFSTLSETKKYNTMSNVIFPRPIAWISTEDDCIINLAPFSYFIPLSSEPPLLIVSIAPKENGEQKDSFVNILKNKKCTINLAHSAQLQELVNSAEDLPKEVSECEKYGIKMEKILDMYPPIVFESQCALFCDFVKTVDIASKYEPVLLEIKQLYVSDQHIDAKGHILLDNIGRVGMEFLTDAKRVIP